MLWGKHLPLPAKRTGCKAQRATAAQDAAGSAELQEEVNRLKSEIAQAGPIAEPKSLQRRGP